MSISTDSLFPSSVAKGDYQGQSLGMIGIINKVLIVQLQIRAFFLPFFSFIPNLILSHETQSTH